MVIIGVIIFPTAVYAQVSPYQGHNAGTDFCIQCHDTHEAAGDYVLTREATVTAICATCHGLFGRPNPTSVIWGSPPPNFSGVEPTASILAAYKVDFTGMSAAQMEAVPGHSLGIMRDGTEVRFSNSIPGGSLPLKVMTSGQYGGLSEALYSGEPVTTFNATRGLYCASCHTAHDTIGQMYTSEDLLSSKPNHINSPVTSYEEFCLACHDKRDNVGPENNHPSSYCLTCHANKAGETDFPHTSSNEKLLLMQPDELCVACHSVGTIP